MISNEKKFSHETMKNNNKISKEKKQTTQSNINCYNSLLIDIELWRNLKEESTHK